MTIREVQRSSNASVGHVDLALITEMTRESKHICGGTGAAVALCRLNTSGDFTIGSIFLPLTADGVLSKSKLTDSGF